MDINLFVNTINGIAQTARSLMNIRDARKIDAIKADLTKSILEAQGQLSEVLGAIIEKNAQIHALQQRVLQLETRQDEHLRYELRRLPGSGDAFAYCLKHPGELSERLAEPIHYACQLCMDRDGIKVILMRNADLNGFIVWRCVGCGSEIRTGEVR